MKVMVLDYFVFAVNQEGNKEAIKWENSNLIL